MEKNVVRLKKLLLDTRFYLMTKNVDIFLILRCKSIFTYRSIIFNCYANPI